MPVVNALTQSLKLSVLLFLFLLPGMRADAQSWFFDTWGVKQGLAEQKVYTLLQDSDEYIWLGTANGLSRFDGKKFENYTFADGLADGGVKSIFRDSTGLLWFGHLNGGGVSVYDGKTFQQVGFDSLKITGDITGIAVSGTKIWFASATDGAIACNFPVKDVKHLKGHIYKGKDGLSDQVFGLSVIHDGSLICVTDAGLRKFDQGENRFQNYRMPHMTTYFSTTCLYNDRAGNIWFGTYNGGMYRYSMPESKMVYYDLVKEGFHSNTVSCITEDSRGRIWVGVWDGGLALFKGDTVMKYDRDNGLKAARIYNIIEDVEGNILIADQNEGLTIFKGDLFFSVNDKSLLPDLNINAVYEDKKGFTWFATNSGISKIKFGTGTGPAISQQAVPGLADIRFLKEDKNGNLWIGTGKSGILMYDTQRERFVPQNHINENLGFENQVTAMEIDQGNNLWIGTPEGIVKGTIGEMDFRPYTVLDSLTVFKITALYCDKTGVMWIGNEPRGKKPGLIKYIPAEKKFQPVLSFTGIIPRTMMMDSKGVLYAGTGRGLLAFRNDSLLTIITKEDGLLSNVVNLIAEAGDGSILVGTNLGLNRYFPGSGRIISYTERNGFTGIEVKPNAFYTGPSGYFWFGTVNGAIRMSQKTGKGFSREPVTRITGLRVNNRPLALGDNIKLSYNERSIQFDYYSICMGNPDVVRYRVMLDGADTGWQPVTDQTRAVYPYIAPGKYRFMVTACNSEGIWSKNPVVLKFTILPPFYRTWWFISFSTLILIILFTGYIKLRERNLIKEKLLLEARVNERTAEVVHKSMIIEEKNRDITASIRYAERIQRAMLPREDAFPDTFVLYLPKDIVSGDFYWMHDDGELRFFAAVDCTGHGVPGAFMAIIGNNSLNKVVREMRLTRPSDILDHLNTEVMTSLLQRFERSINDGMDMSLITIDRKKMILEFAGAYSPLYIVRDGEVLVYKGDRFGIGITTMDKKKRFTNHIIEIRKGDMLYLCSDGYADQFGGPESRKFKSSNVRKILASIGNLPVQSQKEILEKELMDWKGDLDQIDDIMFLGTRI